MVELIRKRRRKFLRNAENHSMLIIWTMLNLLKRRMSYGNGEFTLSMFLTFLGFTNLSSSWWKFRVGLQARNTGSISTETVSTITAMLKVVTKNANNCRYYFKFVINLRKIYIYRFHLQIQSWHLSCLSV